MRHDILPIVLVGSDRLSVLAAEILHAQEHIIYGILKMSADRSKRDVHELPVLGGVEDPAYNKMLTNHKLDYAILEPEATDRVAMLNTLFELTGRHPFSIHHPDSSISVYADVAAGNLVEANVRIGPDARLETLNQLFAGVAVESGVRIGSATTLHSGAIVGADASIGNEVVIGRGAVVLPGVSVGERSRIAAGTVVDRDIPADMAASGRPIEFTDIHQGT
jgi:acetyltransferase-like isoleucine patch superfamily enzyme